MSLSNFLVKLPMSGGHEVVNEMPIPPIMTGILTLVIVVFLLGVVWAFRNLSNQR